MRLWPLLIAGACVAGFAPAAAQAPSSADTLMTLDGVPVGVRRFPPHVFTARDDPALLAAGIRRALSLGRAFMKGLQDPGRYCLALVDSTGAHDPAAPLLTALAGPHAAFYPASRCGVHGAFPSGVHAAAAARAWVFWIGGLEYREATRARLHVGVVCGGLCGEDWVFELARHGGQWKVVETHLLGVS